ncbi:WD40-repeat-containing domain protein [Mycena pura]|uniref:WD40-repeat-containing domain protein n=1 Tax=Mycena pura TaxID=153505 RepID=A0AAD6YHS6_9AGAR|nr:WD40-repeat-containing domain protein [Mycena pura]
MNPSKSAPLETGSLAANQDDAEKGRGCCLPGTRERILTEIKMWLKDTAAPNILWITGFPGSGKTTVACSVVDNCKKALDLRFGASFFFARDDGDFVSPSTMLRAIAFELARNHPAFRDALVADQETYMIDFTTTSVQEQFRRLLEQPLQSFVHEDSVALVIVVDAADECGGLGPFHEQDLVEMLTVIQSWAKLSPLLRLVVTSREERSIVKVLTPISKHLELELFSEEASQDIEKFLMCRLTNLGKKYCVSEAWPSRDDLGSLVRMAKGLFVWATTAVHFLDEPSPDKKLQQLLCGELVEGDITELYKLILKISFCERRDPPPDFLEVFRTFVGAIATASHPLEKNSPILNLLGVETSTAEFICSQLRSVMHGDGYRFRHQSFVDFLISANCPSSFQISDRICRQKISFAILRCLNDSLQFNPTDVKTSHRSNPSAPAVDKFSDKLLYSCQFWADALPQLEGGEEDDRIRRSLMAFFETKFLFWLEVLSLTKQMSCALGQLVSAKKLLEARARDWGLCAFVTDAIKFVEEFGDCMGKSAPHIYLSAIAFCPRNSTIHQTYAPLIQPCAEVTFQTADSLRRGHRAIPATHVHVAPDSEVARSVEGHEDDILSVVFTHNQCVASASYDGTVRFWDPKSGAPVLTPLIHHKKAVTSVACSSDRAYLASGSKDGTATIWDMATREPKAITTFAHDEAVTCVALSPVGTLLVTGCKSGLVPFWSVLQVLQRDAEARPAFREHTSRVTAVAFLDGDAAVSGSSDGSIWMHHLSSERSELLVRGEPIRSLAVTTTPRSIVAVSGRSVVLWTLSDGNGPSGPIYLTGEADFKFDEIGAVAAHGSRVAAAAGTNLRVWDVESRKLILGPLFGHRGLVTSVSFSDDGKRLISGSWDRSGRFSGRFSNRVLGLD